MSARDLAGVDMTGPRKSTGKGHTLYEFELPESAEAFWVLIAESCYEISRTLLEEETEASSIHLFLSGYERNSDRGGLAIVPEESTRYPIQLYHALHNDSRTHELIAELFESVRCVQVSVDCRPYVQPLFYEESQVERVFGLMESIRAKVGTNEVLGLGLEGCRYRRVHTYTPRRGDEIRRAYGLLERKPHLVELLGEEHGHYWHRIY
jgi:hypothetical protein